MPPRFAFLWLLLALLAAPAPAADLPAHFAGQGLSIELVCDATTIEPGQTFHLGLAIHHQPGYHTYWQNPGIAGVPTKLVPQLPPGFTAAALRFPPPDKVLMAALRVHGFERDVLLALPITAPPNLPDGTLTIPVDASWMCCQRTCNPGFAKLSLTLRCGRPSAPHPTWAPRFAQLLAAQPPPLQDWTLSARRIDQHIELTALPPPGLPLPAAPQFFSLDNLICSHPRQAWQPHRNGYQVLLSLSDFPPPDQSHLRGLLFGHSSWLSATQAPYASIAVPIAPATPP